jgi:hypothetical protein
MHENLPVSELASKQSDSSFKANQILALKQIRFALMTDLGLRKFKVFECFYNLCVCGFCGVCGFWCFGVFMM